MTATANDLRHYYSFRPRGTYLLAVDTTSRAISKALPEGKYELRGTHAGTNVMWIRSQAFDGTLEVAEVATPPAAGSGDSFSHSFPLVAGELRIIHVTPGVNDAITAIMSASTGTLHMVRCTHSNNGSNS